MLNKILLLVCTFIVLSGSHSKIYAQSDVPTSNQELIQYLEEKLSSYEKQSENTYLLAAGSLLVSLLASFILYLLASRSGVNETKKEGSRTRNELSTVFWEIKAKYAEVIHSNQRIKDDTSALKRISASIDNQVKYINFIDDHDGKNKQKFIAALQQYKSTIKKLSSDNQKISSDMSKLQEHIADLTFIIKNNERVDENIKKLLLQQENDASDITQIKTLLHYVEQNLQIVRQESINSRDIEDILDSYFGEISFGRKKA